MIKLRGRMFQLYRRVPKRYAPIEGRTFVWVSLHTDSPTVARQKADGVWGQMIEAWEARMAGDTADADKRLNAARSVVSRGVV